MLVYTYFDDDDNEAIKNLQYEMYDYSVSTIIEKIKNIYLNNNFILNYFSKDTLKLFESTDSFDHRLIQGFHDITAATFRFMVKNGNFDNETPEKNNDEVKQFFSDIYIDTNFLDNISVDYWIVSFTWYKYLKESIKEEDYFPTLLLCALLYSITSQQEKAFDCADGAKSFIQEMHKEIPWIKSEEEKFFLEKLRNRDNHKLKYILYDYTKEIEMGYGGTAYHNGYIIFYDGYLSIEDYETDRDSYGDSWHSSHAQYYIQSEEYPEIINILSKDYQCINIEQEDETIKNCCSLLITEIEKTLFVLLISVIKSEKGIIHGGELIQKICGKKITYHVDSGQYDDFYSDCDTCNTSRREIVNAKK